jgi:Type II secretion system (T2SS), protein E, N-terminal domain
MSSLQFAHLVRWTGLQEQCAREGCRTTGLRKSLQVCKGGIRLGADWFCSADCFRDGVDCRIRALQDSSAPIRTRRDSRVPLGLLLVARGCITSAQWRTAREHQLARGGTMAGILHELHFASEREVAAAVATQWGCPVYSANLQPSEIEAHIPSVLMHMLAMAPVYYAPRPNRLLVGFVHRIEHRVLHTIEGMTSCMTEPCFITASQCDEQIRRLEGRNLEVSFERVTSPTEMANIVQSYAFQIGADQARLALCRNHIWARLKREGRPTDLLFTLADGDAQSPEFAGDCQVV